VYRDASVALDEYDRAVAALLISEALVAECDRAWAQAQDEETTSEAQRWRAIAEIHDTFPEIWRHLDRARRVLALRGANTAAYDELRPHARRAASNPGIDGSKVFEAAALEDVKKAIGELKLGLPGADWDAIEARTQGLVRLPLGRRRRQRVAFGAAFAAFAFVMSAWVLSILPAHKPDSRAALAAELQLISEQRKLKIEMLLADVSDRCAPADAHELMRQLRLDGRRADAVAFGLSYTLHCGEDPVVEHWVPRPPTPPAPPARPARH